MWHYTRASRPVHVCTKVILSSCFCSFVYLKCGPASFIARAWRRRLKLGRRCTNSRGYVCTYLLSCFIQRKRLHNSWFISYIAADELCPDRNFFEGSWNRIPRQLGEHHDRRMDDLCSIVATFMEHLNSLHQQVLKFSTPIGSPALHYHFRICISMQSPTKVVLHCRNFSFFSYHMQVYNNRDLQFILASKVIDIAAPPQDIRIHRYPHTPHLRVHSPLLCKASHLPPWSTTMLIEIVMYWRRCWS